MGIGLAPQICLPSRPGTGGDVRHKGVWEMHVFEASLGLFAKQREGTR